MIKKYNLFNRSKKLDKSDFIKSVIDDEVKKSLSFGLEIEKSDIKVEKDVFCLIFDVLWDKLIDDKLTSEMYSKYQNLVHHQVEDLFRYEYYKEKTKNETVKNMYECHINSIISQLFLKISNKLF